MRIHATSLLDSDQLKQPLILQNSSTIIRIPISVLATIQFRFAAAATVVVIIVIDSSTTVASLLMEVEVWKGVS